MGSKEFYLLCKSNNIKLRISDGETAIGRGPFLQVKDHRVSRSHAILSLENGSLKVKPIHTNPTFLCVGAGKFETLVKNEWRVLKSGDTISLLPNDLMFVVGVDQDAFKGTADNSDLPSHSKPENSKPIEPIEDLKKDVKVDDEGNAIKSAWDEAFHNDVVNTGERALERTFHDSIDSLSEGDEKSTDTAAMPVKDNISRNTENEESSRKEKNINTSESGSPIAAKSAQDAVINSRKDKKRVLPSWMLETPSGKNFGEGGSNKSKKYEGSKTVSKVASKRKNQSEVDLTAVELKSHECIEKSQAISETSSNAKRTKKEGRATEQESLQKLIDSDEGNVSLQRDIGDTASTIPKENQSDHLPKSKETFRMVKSSEEALGVEVSGEGEQAKDGRRAAGSSISGRSECKQSVEGKDEYEDGTSKKQRIDAGIAKVKLPDEITEKDASDNKRLEGSVTMQNATYTGFGKTGRSDSDFVCTKPPKCKYGKNCYRKNPNHLSEYSHSDNDDHDASQPDPDLKLECPYGTSCYRQNPQHKLQYKHTRPRSDQQGTTHRPPRKSPRLRNRPNKSALVGEDDDDGKDNDYDYDDSFINDEDEYESDTSSFDDDRDDDEYSPGD